MFCFFVVIMFVVCIVFVVFLFVIVFVFSFPRGFFLYTESVTLTVFCFATLEAFRASHIIRMASPAPQTVVCTTL